MIPEQNKVIPKIATFLYHEVTDDPSQTGFQRDSALPYKHGTKEFNKHLEQIALSSVRPTLINKIDLDSQNKFLLLTFDDGGRSALYIADQIEKRGWRGHFFIVTSLINNKFFLSKQDIIELHSRGHVVGSHSHSHPDIFYDLSFDQMYEEWRVSIDILNSIIQEPVICASIPGGDMDLNTQLSAQESGMKFLFTSEPILNPWKVGEMICLGRVCPKKGSSLNRVRNLAQFKGYKYELFIRKTKSLVKKIIYPYYIVFALAGAT